MLGQLPRARQGLVRVPESNTKYGGKGRKTGVGCRLLFGQVSVSPQGFPSEKNRHPSPNSGFVPLFTGQLFIAGEGLPLEDSGEATGKSGLACRPADDERPASRATLLLIPTGCDSLTRKNPLAPGVRTARAGLAFPAITSILAWPILGERPNLLRVISLAFAGLSAVMGGNGFAGSSWRRDRDQRLAASSALPLSASRTIWASWDLR